VTIRARILKASNPLYSEVFDFDNIAIMFDYMRNNYVEWILTFNEDSNDCNINLTIYDSTVED